MRRLVALLATVLVLSGVGASGPAERTPTAPGADRPATVAGPAPDAVRSGAPDPGAAAAPGTGPSPAVTVRRPPEPLPPPVYDLSVAAPPSTCPAATACVDASAYGAVPGDGGDDADALQAAVAAGTVVFLPAGVYLLGRPLKLRAGTVLAGAGMDRTTVQLAWTKLAGFSFGYLLGPDGPAATDVTVRDLALDGGRRQRYCADRGYTGGCLYNHGGGVDVGTRWTVTRIRFTGFNYFKLWVCGVTGVRIVDNRWDNRTPGTGSGGEDNIGGGCGSADLTVTGNRFDATAVGNVIDLVRARGVRISDNVSLVGSVFLEGVTDSSFTGGRLVGGVINVVSNANYDSAAVQGNQNPSNVTVADNTVEGGLWGINIRYGNRPGARNTPGGGNVVTGNTVRGVGRVGIVVTSCDPGTKSRPDVVRGNTVVDAGTEAAAEYNTGCATFEPVGIGLSVGVGDELVDNTVFDTRAPALTRYGVSVGARSGRPTGTVVRGNTAVGVLDRPVLD